MTVEQMQALISELQAKNAALETATKFKGMGLSVSEKGCVSLSGLRRFPITFYPEEWQKIFDKQDAIKDFINANRDRLSYKTQAVQ